MTKRFARTKRYAAIRLLEHGPLSAPEFQEITRWPRSTCTETLRQLEEVGQIRRDMTVRPTQFQLRVERA